ncbi:cytoplasm protein [Ceratobasidium sp. AG-Ba]|nr:cytoplasm protein [Ceratobasidium sp. AG-Ba]QRV99905.1 cytoplasm protein [Ceratobasidium sp. AG-Ba]QRW14424.1 cytoplasm protein [Ceratobasidium sp. AG-Ba]
MPESTEVRKRSRSPSDSDQHQSHKRVNTGAATNNDDPAATARPDYDSKNADGDHDSKKGTSVAGDGTPGSPSSKKDEPASPTASSSAAPPTPAAQIHMRCLIVTQDASIIIGKGGKHVNEIREKSGARVMVSESIPGNPERILNVSGPLDAVSKSFGLIVRRINDEPFDQPSVPGSRAVTIKFIIPHSRMGSVIGRGGTKIKEIQDASGAKLNASEGMLPGSTERILSVSGVADAIHIATYYVGNILIEAAERHPNAGHSSYRPTGSGGTSSRGPRGSASYAPAPYHGGYGAPYGGYPPLNPYGAPPPGPPGPPQTQQIYIPNDLVGCIIGKGGSKINEIRSMSASQIRIMEPGVQGPPGTASGSPNERLVIITGQPQNIQMAVNLLYQRLEQEKQKQLTNAQNNSTSSA